MNQQIEIQVTYSYVMAILIVSISYLMIYLHIVNYSNLKYLSLPINIMIVFVSIVLGYYMGINDIHNTQSNNIDDDDCVDDDNDESEDINDDDESEDIEDEDDEDDEDKNESEDEDDDFIQNPLVLNTDQNQNQIPLQPINNIILNTDQNQNQIPLQTQFQTPLQSLNKARESLEEWFIQQNNIDECMKTQLLYSRMFGKPTYPKPTQRTSENETKTNDEIVKNILDAIDVKLQNIISENSVNQNNLSESSLTDQS